MNTLPEFLLERFPEFLLERFAEDEAAARDLLRDLEGQIAEDNYGPDERGPYTPARLLAAEMWAFYGGQTKRRNFARGQHIATLANPARVLAECEAKRQIVELHHSRLPHDTTCRDCQRTWPCQTLRLLALPYADHEAFRDEWRP